MASTSYPRPGYNGGFISEVEHEQLMFVAHADGVFGLPTDSAVVFADNALVRTVKINANRVAWVRGSRWESGPLTLTLPQLAANTSGQPRIDLVVLRLDRADYTVKETVITGTPAASPVPPAKQTSTGTTGFYDFPLAEVLVNAGVVNIQGSAVTPRAWYIGSDGQIRCTPTTRPPHDMARIVWDYQPAGAARQLVSNGSAWLYGVEDSGQTSAAAQPTYTLSNNVVYRRNGWVFMALTVERSAIMFSGNTHTPAIIPAGYRPPFVIQSSAVAPTASQDPFLVVQPTGEVQITPRGGDLAIGVDVVISALTWPVA